MCCHSDPKLKGSTVICNDEVENSFIFCKNKDHCYDMTIISGCQNDLFEGGDILILCYFHNMKLHPLTANNNVP